MIYVNNIRAEMARNKVSQKDIANKLGISLRSLNLKLTGKREFKASELQSIAVLLRVDINIFFNHYVNQ